MDPSSQPSSPSRPGRVSFEEGYVRGASTPSVTLFKLRAWDRESSTVIRRGLRAYGARARPCAVHAPYVVAIHVGFRRTPRTQESAHARARWLSPSLALSAWTKLGSRSASPHVALWQERLRSRAEISRWRADRSRITLGHNRESATGLHPGGGPGNDRQSR